MHLKLQFTEAGLAACLSAKDKGLKAQITHMAFGSNAYTPSKYQKALSSEKERISITDYEELGKQIRLAGIFDGELEYAIREIGIFSNDVLLGVYSEPNKLLGYRTPEVKVVQWFTLGIEALPSSSITVKTGITNLNLMMTEEVAKIAIASIDNMKNMVIQHFAFLDLSSSVKEIMSGEFTAFNSEKLSGYTQSYFATTSEQRLLEQSLIALSNSFKEGASQINSTVG